MELTLDQQDIRPQFLGKVNTSGTKFMHFTDAAQQAVKLVGKAKYVWLDTYNMIYPPAYHPISRWQDAADQIPRNKPAADDVMASVKTADGKQVFFKQKNDWVADTKANKMALIGYKLASGFHGENGGQVTHRTVAIMTLAADLDLRGVAKMSKSDVEVLTAGYEEGSSEHTRQEELGKAYPAIRAAILSFF
jgi:hypothetical protein